MAWVKLERGNSWGSEYFSLPGKSKTQGGCCDPKLGINFEEGQHIEVRWPDGTETKEYISKKMFSQTVYDHGHSDSVRTLLPGFYKSFNGAKQWFALDAVELKVL